MASLATVAGAALGATFYLTGKVRRRDRKALHPRGAVEHAVVERRGSALQTGVPWIDAAGTDPVLVRSSRATGLPAPLPDIHGLALRISLPGGYADLLLATTGTGPVTRFLLRPTRRMRSAYTCLLPYRAPCGALLLGAWPVGTDDSRWDLACASLTGSWTTFAQLVMRSPSQDGGDESVSFDPVLHPLPALQNYDWVAQLRRYAYAGSRRARGAAAVDGQARHVR